MFTSNHAYNAQIIVCKKKLIKYVFNCTKKGKKNQFSLQHFLKLHTIFKCFLSRNVVMKWQNNMKTFFVVINHSQMCLFIHLDTSACD